MHHLVNNMQLGIERGTSMCSKVACANMGY